jgi:hypothetical protein
MLKFTKVSTKHTNLFQLRLLMLLLSSLRITNGQACWSLGIRLVVPSPHLLVLTLWNRSRLITRFPYIHLGLPEQETKPGLTTSFNYWGRMHTKEWLTIMIRFPTSQLSPIGSATPVMRSGTQTLVLISHSEFAIMSRVSERIKTALVLFKLFSPLPKSKLIRPMLARGFQIFANDARSTPLSSRNDHTK